jgi:hypothetical protein
VDTKDIISLVEGVFDPVASRLNLTGPIEQSISNTECSIAYMSADLGLEIQIDLGDFFLYSLLFRPTGKEIPTGYDNNAGQRRKIYVQHALESLGLNPSGATKSLQELGGKVANCEAMAKIIAGFVESNWSELERHKSLLFSREKGN